MDSQESDSDTVTKPGIYHDWIPLPEKDAVCCDLCGLTVSITEFRNLRDTKCDDWLEAT